MPQPEAIIQKQVRLAVASTKRATLARNSVGFDETKKIKYGLGTGSADLVGMLIPSGRVFCLEIKTPKGRATREQLLWLETVRRFGGFAAIVRSAEEALEALDRAERGACE